MWTKVAHRRGGAWASLARASIGLAIAAAVGSFGPREASADAPSPAPGAGPACDLTGTAAVAKGVELFRSAQGKEIIATFTGALAPLTMQDIPADAKAERARLSTTARGDKVRLDGFAVPSQIPVFTTRDIAAVGTQVWVAGGQPVRLVASEPGKLTVERVISGTQSQTVRATAPCDAFALEPRVVSGGEIDGHARGFMMKRSTIDLYDAPNGKVVFTLKMLEGAAQLFWSNKVSAGFVQVESRGDLVVDAWAKASDLDPLRPGELSDRLIPPIKQITGAKLKLEDAPRIVKATTDVPIRARREINAPAIGLIEVGAELYVLETVAGWTNILPRELYVTPPDPGGFWIPSGEVPKGVAEPSP